MEYRSRSLRIADDVWLALQKHEMSANQILRLFLLNEALPEEFGAVGDGKTNNTVAFQSAMDSGASQVTVSGVHRLKTPVSVPRRTKPPLLKPKERK